MAYRAVRMIDCERGPAGGEPRVVRLAERWGHPLLSECATAVREAACRDLEAAVLPALSFRRSSP